MYRNIYNHYVFAIRHVLHKLINVHEKEGNNSVALPVKLEAPYSIEIEKFQSRNSNYSGERDRTVCKNSCFV